MNDHYYTHRPESVSQPETFKSEINNFEFTFKTDEGVFSKKRVDYGTRALLSQFKPPEASGDFLDVGCGYGPIGITLAKQFPDRYVHMIDINERAVNLAKENIRINEIINADALISDGFESVKDRSFASVITNPPFRAGKKVVHQIVEDSHKALKPGGTLWVVVQKKQGAPSLQKKLESLFDNVEIVKRDKGYYVLAAKKFD